MSAEQVKRKKDRGFKIRFIYIRCKLSNKLVLKKKKERKRLKD
jgi:hypothetical protein